MTDALTYDFCVIMYYLADENFAAVPRVVAHDPD